MDKKELKKILFSLDNLYLAELEEERKKIIYLCSLAISGEIVLSFSGQKNLSSKVHTFIRSYNDIMNTKKLYYKPDAEILM